jgi:hypothetical protein
MGSVISQRTKSEIARSLANTGSTLSNDYEDAVTENYPDNPDVQDWMRQVGGVAMALCSTRRQLLSLTLRAPDDYCFGIAFGRIIDILALKRRSASEAHPIVFEQGPLDDLERALQNEVFDRAILLERAAEALDMRGYDALTYLYSREKSQVLRQQLKDAKHPFVKGQLTSWLIIHEVAAIADAAYLVS